MKRVHLICLMCCLVFLSACAKKKDQTDAKRPGRSDVKKNTPYDVVRVFYGTDRSPSGSNKPNDYYGNGRHDIQFGTCEISIPKKHKTGKLEAPSVWRLEFRENPKKHVMLLNVKPMGGLDFLKELQAEVAATKEQEAFIFIHGFNVTFKDAARRTAQIAHDLNFQGAPILYSWPSKGDVTKYATDRTTAEWSETHVAHFIEAVAHESGAKRIHLIAHSMGNRLMTRAIKQMVTTPFSGVRPHINQIILTAPDIDADVFRNQIAPQIVQVADRVTIYASSNDKALLASGAVNGAPRLGQAGKYLQQFPRQSKIEVVDASKTDTSLFGLGHSYFSNKPTVLTDISQVLHGFSASQRKLFCVKKGAWVIRNLKQANRKTNITNLR